MKAARSFLTGALSAASVFFAGSAITTHGQTLFSDSLDAATGWQVNQVGANDLATFGYDYSALGIPASPNGGGSTIGLRLDANRPLGPGLFSGISVSPIGQSFTDFYELRFDLWQNYPSSLAGSGTGSTQLSGGGIMTAGTTPQWAGATYDSIFFLTTGDGALTTDYRVYPKGNNAAASTGFYAAGTGTTARDSADPYYSTFGGTAVPAAQTAARPGQEGASPVGAQGFAWHDVAITKFGNTVTWDIDGKRIATVNISGITGFGGGNIELIQSDINATQTDGSGSVVLFGLFDNVRVTAVPEPSTVALLGLAGAALLVRRYRSK